MTHIFKDGFDLVDPTVWTVGALPGRYGTTVPTTPRTGTHFMNLNNNPAIHRDLNSTDEDDGMFVGFGWFVTGSATLVTFDALNLYEAQGATHHIRLECLAASRGWRVRRGDGTVLIDVLPNVFFHHTWHYVELGVKIANSGGTVTLRQDGITIAGFTGDTQNGGTDGLIDRVQIVGNSLGNALVDDVYINNEQGSAPDNTFWGDTRIFPSYPDGNGNYSQLVGSDGNSVNNYQQVDEVGAASTADFNASATDGEKDTYTFQDLPVSVGTIRGVEIRMNAEKSDAGVKGIRSVTRRSSTDSFGQDFALSEDDAPYMELLPTDPIAAAAWTIPNFNATEFGAEVQDL